MKKQSKPAAAVPRGSFKLTYVDINTLREAEYNPRKANEKEFNDLKMSLENFGFVDPVIVNDAPGRKNIIIGGHFRVRVAKTMGIKEAPVIYITVPDLEREQELNLRLNKNTGQFDFDALANIDEALLEKVGFGKEELDRIFTDYEPDALGPGGAAQDAGAKIPNNPQAKRGDIYALGEHRLICGDATNPQDLRDLVGDRKASLLFTDPPYGVDYAEKNKHLNKFGKQSRIERDIKNDALNTAQLLTLWKKAFENANTESLPGAAYYICTAYMDGLLYTMMQAVKEAGWFLKHMVIWVKKNNFVLGRSDYQYKHEPILHGFKEGSPVLYGWKKGGHKFYGPDNASTVWEIDKPHDNDLHPTMKPVELIVTAILNSSARGQVVLDVFAGSGSTVIAAERTGRICYAVELDPAYVDVTIERWEQFTGKKARKVRDGEGMPAEYPVDPKGKTA